MSICASKDPSFQAMKTSFAKLLSQIGAKKLGNFVIFFFTLMLLDRMFEYFLQLFAA